MVAAFDNNKVANHTYEHNFGLKPVSSNLEHRTATYFSKLNTDLWLLSPPCQPYTRGGKMLDDQDERATALLHLINVLDEISNPPKWIFLENVLNFEVSRSRHRLMEVLARRGYRVKEFLVSPMDPWVNIPNDRLRYYLAAERLQEGPIPMKDDHIIKSLEEVLGPAPESQTRKIEEFLRPDGQDPQFLVPLKYLEGYINYKHDIRRPAETKSTTFTKAYGSNYIIGTGSFLQTKRLDLIYEPDDRTVLPTLGLRFFTPYEIALLHALPVIDASSTVPTLPVKFTFPADSTVPQQYRLLGNSLNVRVVTRILSHLLQVKLRVL